MARVILVTNNYHMPRSLLEMGRLLHGARLEPYPVVNTNLDNGGWLTKPEALRVLFTEYSKYLLALARGIVPIRQTADSVALAAGRHGAATERCWRHQSAGGSRPSAPRRPRNLLFEAFDAPVALGKCGCHVGRLEALRNMLRAIGIPGRDGEQDDLLGARLVVLRHQLRHQLGIVLDDARRAPDLDALPCGIVDQEQESLGVVGQIALRDELPVAGEIGKADGACSSSTFRKPAGPPRCWI